MTFAEVYAAALRQQLTPDEAASYEMVMQTSGVGEFQPVVSVQVDHDARKVYLRD
jgi:hypothetical protein